MLEFKNTQLLADELEIIADTVQSNYCRQVLKESARRLNDLEKIAEFYRKEAERLQGKRGRKNGQKQNRTNRHNKLH